MENPTQMDNWVDPSISAELKERVREIITQFDLKGLRVRFVPETQILTFTQDRRVVEVPVVLVQKKRWSDIRYLFRAILGSAPSAWNSSADDNDWSAYKR